MLWKIEKIIKNGNYNRCLVRNHPKRNKHNYVLEHKVIIENHIGRLLEDNEIIHHIDGNTKNNKIENLEILNYATHRALHARRKYVILKCPLCKIIFIRPQNQSFIDKKTKYNYTCCCRNCAVSFGHKIKKYGINTDIKKLIDANLIKAILINYKNVENEIEKILKNYNLPPLPS